MHLSFSNPGKKPPDNKQKPFHPFESMSKADPKKNSEPHQEDDPLDLPLNSPTSQPIRQAGKRRRARELALQIFYAMEISGQEAQESIQRIRECFNYPESAWEYALPLVLGVEKHRVEIDKMIQQSSEHWSLHRMAHVDRNLLRLAVYELMFCPDIPKKVTLNEAVDLGKKFGAEDTGAFVNGVLDRVASLLEK